MSFLPAAVTTRLLLDVSTCSFLAVGKVILKRNQGPRLESWTSTPRPMISWRRSWSISNRKQPHPHALRHLCPTTQCKRRKRLLCLRRRRETTWCISLWNEWRDDRNSRSEEQVPSDICALSPEELQRWLSRFVLQVRKMDGKEYCPDTLYHIVCGVMRFLRQNGKPEIDLLKEQCYADFRSTLDAEMKRLKRASMGSRKRQAEPRTPEEELLWEKRILGDHSPQALLNSVFFFNGVCFALRSGDEHRRLRFKECQIQVVEKPGERAYLMYTEDSSKNNQGGLKGCKLKTKEVVHHENTTTPSRGPVRLFRLYNNLCPKDRPENAFYLQPLRKPKQDCWFAAKPLGHNPLDSMVKEMCKAAGITGYKTNHSLRTTTATRLFQAGVDEQLIMERTGHRSLDGVRSYKRTSQEQRQALSDIVNLTTPQPKKLKMMSPHNPEAATCSQNTQQMGLAPAQISLQSCNNITFNITYGSV